MLVEGGEEVYEGFCVVCTVNGIFGFGCSSWIAAAAVWVVWIEVNSADLLGL